MRIALPLASGLTGLIALLACATQAAELPSVEQLRQQMGFPPQTVSVYEAHLSVGDEHVEVQYVGYPAVDVFEHVFGKDWRGRAETVELRALDGYVVQIDARRFLEERAFLVFARKDNAPFTVDNIRQNQTDVPLGPWYLVWDNISNPALLAEGAESWPYQVTEIDLVSVSDAALLPEGFDARFREGAELVRTHCLACHKVNGFGGAKFEGNLAKIVKRYSEEDLLRLVLTPASARRGATMPALSDRLPEPERRRIAGIIFDYLKAVPVQP